MPFLLTLLIAVSWCPTAHGFSFDDIEFWVGSGANRAALVIDWSDTTTEPPALVWGYRWEDGTEARGNHMLRAIIAADPRLVAKLGGSPGNPVAVYGLGYDADNDSNDEAFRLKDTSLPPVVTMPFDEDGFLFTSPADGEFADDAGDLYCEGWFTGFWHYGIASTNPYDGGSWSDIFTGMANRVLTDGAWDSWVFSPSFNFTSFAENPQAAAPPFTRPGDFNGDGDVDDEDYDDWTSTFGSTSALAADATGDQVVDAADYVIWRANESASLTLNVSSSHGIPEPATIGLVFVCLMVRALFRFRHHD